MINLRYVPGLVFAAGAVLVSVVLVFLFDDGVIGNDLAQTVSVARNLIGGSGLQTDLIYYDVHYSMLAPLVPQTVFPPGQSLLVAPLMMLGATGHSAALVWSLIAFLVSGLFLTLTVRQFGVSNTTVIIVGIAWLLLGVNWNNVLACRSEALLTTMTVAGLYSFVGWVNSGNESRRMLALLSVVAAMAFLFRYQGLFFIGCVGLYFLIRAVRLRNWQAVFDLLTVSAFPVSVVIFALVYNIAVTGGPAGGPVSHVEHSASVSRIVVGFYYEFSKLLGVSKEGLLRGGGSEVIAIALIGYLGFLLTKISSLRPLWQRPKHGSAFLFCTMYVVVSMAAFVYLSLTKSTGYIQARYLSTLIPFVIVLLVLLGQHVHRASVLGAGQRRLGLVLIIGFVGFGQARAVSEQLDSLAADLRLREIRSALALSYAGDRSVGTFLQSEIDAGNHLLSNQSQLVGYALERPTFGLTPALYTAREFDVDEVQRMSRRHGIRYVMLFPRLYDPAAPQNANRTILTELANHDFSDPITPVFEAQNVRLYRIE